VHIQPSDDSGTLKKDMGCKIDDNEGQSEMEVERKEKRGRRKER
jgi:hypothetical protein